MSALDFDAIHWEIDGDGNLTPLDTPLDINYPDESDVRLGTIYGTTDQYTGTATLGSSAPDAPILRVVNNDNGTATATISSSAAGSTTTVYRYVRNGGAYLLQSVGTVTGDDTLTLNGTGDYTVLAISMIDGVRSIPSHPVPVSVTNGKVTCIRDSTAQAEYQCAKLSQYGIQVVFQNGDTDTAPVTVWATLERGGVVTQLRDTQITDVDSFIVHIPRQEGFPPSIFRPGWTITYGDHEWEGDDVQPSNGLIELSSSFRMVCGSYREAGNY
jgi:hypothetical protein